MINIAEVARLAGVSPATVSRVLNNTAPVREKTRQRVLQVIEENRYTPNIAARNLSLQNKLNNIGVVIPDIDNPFFCAILKGITQAADRYSYNVVLFNSDELPEREHRFLQTVREQNLKGLIMIPLSEQDEETLSYLVKLEESGVPVVLVDRHTGGNQFSGVFTDDISDAYRATEVLIRSGHKRIATIAGQQRATSGRNRLWGFRQAMEDNSLPVPQEYIEFGEFKFDASYSAAERLLSLPEPPTAIFAANNFATLAVLRYAMERGLMVGHDFSLLGFDEIEGWLRYSPMLHAELQLSLVERPVGQIAWEAVEMLQNRIVAPDEEDSRARRAIVLHNEIVLRGSELLK